MLGLLASMTVSAQDAASTDPTDSPLYFPKLDKNHDGQLGRSEIPKELSQLRAHFDQYDTNHDHRLSENEYANYLSVAGQGACSSNDFTAAKCANMPYARGQENMGFSVPAQNAPKVQPQGQH